MYVHFYILAPSRMPCYEVSERRYQFTLLENMTVEQSVARQPKLATENSDFAITGRPASRQLSKHIYFIT